MIYKNIIVLTNKPLADFAPPIGLQDKLINWSQGLVFWKYPKARQAFLRESDPAGANAVRLINNPPAGVRICVYEIPSKFGTFCRTSSEIKQVCENGYYLGLKNANELIGFLNKYGLVRNAEFIYSSNSK